MTTTFVNDDPVDADWSQRFGFGGPRGVDALRGICIHTTENPLGTPAENVARYQINSETGSYHALVDDTANDHINSIKANTADWIAWAAGWHGNQLFLHLAFVCYASMSREEWLKATRMLAEGADVAAFWCVKFGFPVHKLVPQEIRVAQEGLCGHADISATWHEVDHTDPGRNFPWDVFLRMVQERVDKIKNHTQKKEVKPMTTLDTRFKSAVEGSTYEAPLSQFILNADAHSWVVRQEIEHMKTELAEIKTLLKEKN